MKKLSLIITILIGLIITACSTDEISSPSVSSLNISKSINKQYTFYDSNFNLGVNAILTDSIEIILNNNKIVNYTGLSNINDIPKTIIGNIIYANDRISQLERFENNQLISSSEFIYDNSGELIERQSKEWDSSIQEFFYEKSEFTHTTDTIFSNYYNSSNNVDFTLISSNKTVLDTNNNRIYYESNYGIITETYDSDNNILSSDIFGSTLYNYTYSTVLNTQALINNNTIGKKIQSMIFGEGNLYTMDISTNTPVSASKGPANPSSAQVETTVNQENYSTKTIYIESSNGNSERQEINEYIFD